MHRNLSLLALLSALALSACSSAGGGRSTADDRVTSYAGHVPPEIGAGAQWLNAQPTSLAGLRGRVVFLQFSFPTCPACKVMPPYMVRWDSSYRDQGLTVLYVADGRRVTSDAFASALQSAGATFPLVHDSAAATTLAYGVRAYPTAYVIGRDGRVVWEGIPSFNADAVEQAIRGALSAR